MPRLPTPRHLRPRVWSWVFLAAPVALLWAAAALADEAPAYRFDVRILPQEHRIEGTVTVTLPSGDARVGPQWRFALPPNRFLTLDRRGIRRDLESPQFDRQVEGEDLDPMLPSGFTPAGIDILAAWDEAGPLSVSTESDPHMPNGYSPEQAWLEVRAPDGRALTAVTLRFRTTLPKRYVDGWSGNRLFLESWYPSLANGSATAWSTDLDAPRPGVFSGTLRVSQEGWLVAGPGLVAHVHPGDAMDLPEDMYPARSLPLVYLDGEAPHPFAMGSAQGVSFDTGDGERVEQLSRSIASRFAEFMQAQFGLQVPDLRPGAPAQVVLV